MTIVRLKEFGKNSIHWQIFTAPSNFKSYEELKTRLDAVLSGKQVVSNQTVEDEPIAQPKVDTKPVENKQGEDEDTMDYFNKLAKCFKVITTETIYHICRSNSFIY